MRGLLTARATPATSSPFLACDGLVPDRLARLCRGQAVLSRVGVSGAAPDAGLGQAPGPGQDCATGPGQAARLPRPPVWMSDGHNRCSTASTASPEPRSLEGQSLTLETAVLASHQPSDVAPQRASCTLVKPEVTSASGKPPVSDADFSPKGRRGKGVRCMEPCRTVRSLLPSRPKAVESGPRAEPSIRTPHARPD